MQQWPDLDAFAGARDLGNVKLDVHRAHRNRVLGTTVARQHKGREMMEGSADLHDTLRVGLERELLRRL